MMAAPRSLVPALPPRSGVRVPPSASTSAIARSTACAAAALAEMLEHHRARPDLADRVGDAAAGDVGRRAVHRLEHRGVFALGVDVAGGRDADRADAGRPEIGQDVAEQVGADDDVEPVGMAHEMRGQDVDVVLVGLDVGIVARRSRRSARPNRASYG